MHMRVLPMAVDSAPCNTISAAAAAADSSLQGHINPSTPTNWEFFQWPWIVLNTTPFMQVQDARSHGAEVAERWRTSW